MKIALVHDWIIESGGAERVLMQLHRLWPQAPIYTLLHRPETVQRLFPIATIISSSLQKSPRAWGYHSYLAPLMPSAIEAFDLSEFDTVISSSVIFSKGIVVRPDTRHICYCYSPTRMLWDRAHSYERDGVASKMYRHLLRSWDFSAAQRPDQMLAISHTTADRIKKYYHRSSIVVPPPTRQPGLADTRLVPDGDYYLVVARLIPHKMLDLVIDAFAKLRYQLVIVGDGPLRARLIQKAGNNILFTGRVSDTVLDGLYENCRAVIVPNEEDWGLTAIEAMLHGKPVLALRRGGATESVLEGLTGEFFDDPIPEALADGVKRIKSAMSGYNPSAIASHASQYGEDQFRQRMQKIINTTA